MNDDAEPTPLEDCLRDLAYDIELDRGVVLSLLVVSAAEFDAQTDRPFFTHVQRDSTELYG